MYVSEVKLPQGLLQITPGYSKKILLVAAGREPLAKWLQSLDTEMTIYAVDKGMDYCLKAGILPQALYGDKDSANEESWIKAHEAHVLCKEFLPEKDDTDLQLLLKDLPSASTVVATGIWSGRFDHLYANVFSLLAYKKEKKSVVILADEKEVLVIMTAGERVIFTADNKPKVVSLLPLGEKNKVSIKGVKWPLEDSILEKQRPYAISNELLEKEIEIQCSSGEVGLYFNFEGE